MVKDASDPAELGFDADRLGRLRPWMQRYVEIGRIPGAQVLVARRGRIVHFQATGHRDVATGQPMQGDTILRIASMTKPITSVALMMLFEEGRVSLRNVRRDVNKHADQIQKSGELTEDENHQLHDEIQKLLKDFEAKVTERQDAKTKEIMEV